jgi:oxygen-dependent protoporphyrinogen oxidase
MQPERMDSAAPTTWRVAVIGGGLAGLAAANRLAELCAEKARPLDLVLFEAGSRLGGVVETRHVAGYRVELGGDSFITNKPWAVDLCRRLGIEERLIPTDARYRRSLVLRRGRPLPVPDEFQLLSPVSVGAVLRSPIFSWPGKLRMALEYVLPRGKVETDESLGHFVRRRFGREALVRLVQPLVGGIYTSDPEKLSLRATMPRFLEMEKQHGSLIRALRRQKENRPGEDGASGARYGLFATLARGVSELVDALASRISKKGDIRLGTEVVRAYPEGDRRGFLLEFADGSQDAFDAVVVALPAYRAAGLISDFAQQAAALLNRIEYASTAIVASGHKLADIRDPPEAFGLVVPAVEKRNILAVSFTSRKFPDRAPEGSVQLRTFVGGAMQPELLDRSDAEIVALVRAELESIFGVTWKPDFTIVARWMRSMPQYHVGHLDLVAGIERELAGFHNLALAGNAYRGVGIPDVIHSGELAAERILASA